MAFHETTSKKELANTMIRMILAFSALLIASAVSGSAVADVADITIDASQSFTSISILGSTFQTSATSGGGRIEFDPSMPPFSSARITELQLVLDDGLNFSFLGGLVSANTAAGDVGIDLLIPGAAGAVSGGEFDQLSNLLGLSGDVNVVDPLNAVGGNQTVDLSSFAPDPVDFVDVQISRVGDTVTMTMDYEINQILNIGGMDVALIVTGHVVGSGLASVPEPASAGILMAFLVGAAARRRRR